MPIELRIPDAGESITEVRVGSWRKSVGDTVSLDEVVVEIETDKASMELPSPVSGSVSKILKEEGDEAAVGDVIALILEGAVPQGEPSKVPAQLGKAPEHKGAQPVTEKDKEEPRVMPSARRVLGEAGLAPSQAKGSGPGGRILKEDAIRATGAAEPAAPATPVAEPRSRTQPSAREEETVPMTPMRKVIARNLVAAQRSAALLTTFNEVDMTAVIGLRRRYGELFRKRHGVKLGFMSFFVKASVEALMEVPAVNARIDGTNVVYRKYHDVGIAVGGGRGLVVPVLRNAESMAFADIELAIADFAERARRNRIELSELQGGTFTISNGGIYGSMLSTPIVNPPQSGILGMHAIQDRPMAVDGKVEVRPMMYVALTYDHRIVDGREAVTFLRKIKDLVEDPERIWLRV